MAQSHQEYLASLENCAACAKPITGNKKTSTTSKKSFHAECFACSTCHVALGSGGFFEDAAGRLFCATHWAERQGNVCAACNRPVSGKIVSAIGNKYHPDCFVCTKCHSKLSGHFALVDGRLQCAGCAK